MQALAALLALGTASLLASPVEVAVPVDEGKVEALAKAARTPEEHLAVAAHYQARATALETKAARHEENVEELANRRGYNAMAHRWPGLAQGPLNRERSQAMEARRAAREARHLMAKHRGLAARASGVAAE